MLPAMWLVDEVCQMIVVRIRSIRLACDLILQCNSSRKIPKGVGYSPDVSRFSSVCSIAVDLFLNYTTP